MSRALGFSMLESLPTFSTVSSQVHDRLSMKAKKLFVCFSRVDAVLVILAPFMLG